jgi:hypothetical protein
MTPGGWAARAARSSGVSTPTPGPFGDMHGDAFAMPQHPQLLQRLGLFQRAGGRRGKAPQEAAR